MYDPYSKDHYMLGKDEFQFRWLEKSIMKLGNAVSIPSMFNHLNLNYPNKDQGSLKDRYLVSQILIFLV